ncbi:MAG: TFIIB-type zinc finger domain-containing protein [Oscillospiraceae bacterium]|nr:TFIIB-type zinc finger domain-containing protein [Oscillospiraceae bacterium]
MKALVCELCSSNDIVKQDGFYVCQHCGTKYSPEEAKKLMVEGVVKIDTSDELANLYQIARRAKEDLNAESAAKYYDMIQVKDPTSWEAAFYSVYFKAMNCTIAEMESAAISVSNCIDSVLELIKDHIEEKAEQIEAVNTVAAECIGISSFLYKGAKKHYNEIDISIRHKFASEMNSRCLAAKDILCTLGNSIDAVFNDYPELHATAVEAWKQSIDRLNYLATDYTAEGKAAANKLMTMYASKIQNYEPSYSPPLYGDKETSSGSSGGGCYVATAVYGSYDCPQVWTLRRYRDDTLAETWYGRAFIHTYYAISPTLVKWFGKTAWFQNLWRGKLDRWVRELNDRGVEDTPYQDRNW